MAHPRDVLTPDALSMLQQIAATGSFAAAARARGMVPSALTYRVRQIEDALDVLLFDRSSRQARPTVAGAELLRAGARLLDEIDATAHRVKRVATGWEPQLTIAADSIVSRGTLMELAEAFFALAPPTRLKIRDEVLSGTFEALVSGQADLAIGALVETATHPGVQTLPIGKLEFVYAVAPGHPLAREVEPLPDAVLERHRIVAVADSAQRGGGHTVGILGGQDVFTVSSMQDKIAAQVRGLGAGFLPEPWIRQHVATGRLVVKKVARPVRRPTVRYAWLADKAQQGRALQWWLAQLQSPATRTALLENHADPWPAHGASSSV
jgi:DNA-binding transcriptional LysR family regulator